MPKLISDTQSAFVQGRQILDGVLIANEVIDEAKRLKREAIFLKVDFDKAYDSVDWDFLDFVLGKMGFPMRWRNWIRVCISTSWVSVLIDGSPTDEFKMERGLRQGDPLSPFLFILVAEGFNVLMSKAVEVGNFVGYKVGDEEEQSISHLQFADDTLIIGLKVNYNKSELIGVNVQSSWLCDAANTLNCKVGTFPTKYLGLPIGCDPRKIRTWEPVINSLRKKLSSWKCRSLSMGRRLVLLKSVLSALPIYFLSFCKVPPGIISSIESLFKKILWGGVKRQKRSIGLNGKVCKPKQEGGLGIKDLKLFNIALLGKWWWRLKNENDVLWHRVLVCRYGKSLDKVNSKSSIWWRDLNLVKKSPVQGGMDWFEENLVKVVGNGRNTLFWRDPWVGGESLYKIFDRLYDISIDKDSLVFDMLVETEGVRRINWRWRRNLFQWENELVEVCNSLVLGVERKEDEPDSWQWGGDSYTVLESGWISYLCFYQGQFWDADKFTKELAV
ncbi:hypothetical protein TSUD_92030 [Trifolium subterraneum]|uniref:Reverse transcriptase domain-containing protein n=1 Tax=Trifolium subterraneum TaxID=3900 RepID=A0A2Z6P4R4_TRISU|nr:hypothetical protein TSUD_92030 [Trifolium subterraneum]